MSKTNSAIAGRVARLEALAASALVDREAGKTWLNQPQGALGGQVPQDLILKDEAGARQVEAVLHQIEHDVYI